MAASLSSKSELDEEEDKGESPSTALMKPQREDVVWSSAAKARNFLESVSGTRTPSALARLWSSRRGGFYLAVAVILVVVVIRWGIWSNHPVGATSHGTPVSGTATRRKQ